MITVSASDIAKKPSLVTNPKDLTIIEDVKKKIAKSVIIPYEMFKELKEDIEYKLWLKKNKDGLVKLNEEFDGIFDEAIYELGQKL